METVDGPCEPRDAKGMVIPLFPNGQTSYSTQLCQKDRACENTASLEMVGLESL